MSRVPPVKVIAAVDFERVGRRRYRAVAVKDNRGVRVPRVRVLKGRQSSIRRFREVRVLR